MAEEEQLMQTEKSITGQISNEKSEDVTSSAGEVPRFTKANLVIVLQLFNVKLIEGLAGI